MKKIMLLLLSLVWIQTISGMNPDEWVDAGDDIACLPSDRIFLHQKGDFSIRHISNITRDFANKEDLINKIALCFARAGISTSFKVVNAVSNQFKHKPIDLEAVMARNYTQEYARPLFTQCSNFVVIYHAEKIVGWAFFSRERDSNDHLVIKIEHLVCNNDDAEKLLVASLFSLFSKENIALISIKNDNNEHHEFAHYRIYDPDKFHSLQDLAKCLSTEYAS